MRQGAAALTGRDVQMHIDLAIARPAYFDRFEHATSARTLRRRLDEEQAPFATLLKEARKEKAIALLGARELTIEEVALRLGYSSLAAFTRAFTTWTGTTPSEFRKRSLR